VIFGLIGIFVLVPALVALEPAIRAVLGWTPLFSGPFYGVSMFSAGVVLTVMIIPFIISISREVILAVPTEQREGALARVETRPSVLYARLFGALGDYARGIESILFSIAIVFAIIELLALWIGTKLTRSITSSVADLYGATTHVNRGDFSHRIAVKSSDQLAALATSFNSMTASIERLVQEQKEKQRLQNELAIAQEVQAQLFPKEISQLESLEVHGFCRPARTVSGDYYDFLVLNSGKMILAVGDRNTVTGAADVLALLAGQVAQSLDRIGVVARMARRHLKAMTANIADAILVVDEQDVVRYSNAAATALFPSSVSCTAVSV